MAGGGSGKYARTMLTSHDIAVAWLDAFNRHDVPALIALYAEHATHSSPKIRVLHPETGGKVVGREAIRAWWAGAVARLPGLRYEAATITAQPDRVVIEYVRHAPDGPAMPIAEAFDIEDGRVVASRVYHG